MEENNNNKKVSGLAITSLVLSLVGLVILGIPCGIGAVVTGIIGLVKFNKETDKGKGMAIAGLIVGALDLIICSINLVLQIALLS